MTASEVHRAPELVRTRFAASSVFVLYGLLLGTWTARIPAIKRGLTLSDSRLSFALLAFAGGAVLVVCAVVLRPFVSTSPDASAPAHSGSDAPPLPGVWFLGLLAFCCLVGEGAAADWSAVYLRDELATSAAFAATAYAVFSVAMM